MQQGGHVRARVAGVTFNEGDEVYVQRVDRGQVKHFPSGVYDAGEAVIHVVTETRDPRRVSPQEIVEAVRRFLFDDERSDHGSRNQVGHEARQA